MKSQSLFQGDKLKIHDKISTTKASVYQTYTKHQLKFSSRLDYILISESLSNVIENFIIKPVYRSDHSAVILELKFNSFERGRGLWKFNNSILTDKICVDKVKETIERMKIQYDYSDNLYICSGNTKEVGDSLFLEVLLMEIRGLSISYSSYKKKEQGKMEIL